MSITLKVSFRAYAEIRAKLIASNLHDRIQDDGLNMDLIELKAENSDSVRPGPVKLDSPR